MDLTLERKSTKKKNSKNQAAVVKYLRTIQRLVV